MVAQLKVKSFKMDNVNAQFQVKQSKIMLVLAHLDKSYLMEFVLALFLVKH